MNPTPGESKLTGMVSVELGGLKLFERQLSEKEAEFLQDVVETALIKYALAYLRNRADQGPSKTPEETHGPPSGLQSKVADIGEDARCLRPERESDYRPPQWIDRLHDPNRLRSGRAESDSGIGSC
jgi:hypothetical protein